MVTPAVKREAVAHVRVVCDVSERRACRVIGLERSVQRYQRKRRDDSVIRKRLCELALERRRFGFRRLGQMLARENIRPNHKKLLRIYREAGLTVKRRNGHKRALGTRLPLTIPQGPDLADSYMEEVDGLLVTGEPGHWRIDKESLS